MSKGKILFQLSGSIACFKAAATLSKLVQEGFEIEVVATKRALEFVGLATLEGLLGKPVHTDLYEPGKMMDHIRLIRWCDVAILAPASANTLAKMANGIADDLVSTLFLAHDFSKPYVVAPAMNVAMYRHPATRANVEKLRAFGVSILDASSGRLACGEVGEGRMVEPEEIVRFLKEILSTSKTKSAKHVLITSGGTREAIDGVRYIGNASTGRTGAEIADELVRRGHAVTLLRAENSVAPRESVNEIKFSDFKSLESALKTELGQTRYDAVIHAAAVSDFSIATVDGSPRATSGKIESSNETLVLGLKRNPKLIDSLKQFSKNPSLKVVAFKLTDTEEQSEKLSAVKKLSDHAKPDWIVHNDMHAVREGRHGFSLYESSDLTNPARSIEGAQALAMEISVLIEDNRPQGPVSGAGGSRI